MSGDWRRGWAACCALAAAGLFACGDEAPQAPGPGRGGAVPVAGGPAFRSAAQCGACHTEIYAEWKASMHGQAMSDPLFLTLSDGLQQEECIRCHAPEPLRPDFGTTTARSDDRADAITCLTCHQSGDRVAGPLPGLSGACRPVHDPDQTDVEKICFGCHNMHKTGDEWKAGPYGPDAPTPRVKPLTTCLECHMPAVERPLVVGGPVRRGRRHTWPGGHDLDHVRKAAVLEVEAKPGPEGVRVTTWVANVGAGHNIPTDARHRSFDVYVRVWDAAGRLVLDPLDPAQQSAAHSAEYRLNYRNSNLPDTQIPPGKRVSGLGRWKGYVDVAGVRAGRGEAWLVYRLTPEDVLVEESLTDPEFVVYRARRVAVVPFTF